MTAIYKKELRSYFTSMTGYICMAFMLVVIGIYFAVINLSSGYPYFGYTLSCVIVLFLLMTPVLTMRILAEEKNRKTDQLLLTAPVSLWKIVIGKYLAMVTVFGLALLITGALAAFLARPLSRGNGKRETLLRLGGLLLAMLGALVTMKVL